MLAAGPLHEPVLPDTPGLARFSGTAFHSSRWDHDHDLRGERVAVIGTGASAAQFVPRIQPQVGQLTVFQRTPPWVMPKPDWRIGPRRRALMRRLPVLQRAARQVVWTWDGSPRAFRGTSVAGFPNAFVLFGPNIGSASAFVMLDAQLRYLVGAMRAMRAGGWSSFDVRQEAQDADKADVDARPARSAWNAGGCTSYYLDAKGHNASVFPGTMRRMQRLLARFPVESFEVRVERAAPVASSAQ